MVRSMLRGVVCLLVLVPVAVAAQAKTARYSCSNAGLEVQCSDGECSASDAFTPMAVSFTDGELRVCAYSGCWEGPSEWQRDESGLMVVGHDMTWSDQASAETFRLALSFEDMRAVLLGGSFAQPLNCAAVQ
ncbi:hypothetical protein [Pseudogemmobacter bohemicus]|uniref:hypothetical protein n=1 Tax=Pseudogemmobacter bohemicus TaxID=2250708 RepID=UPI001300B2E7|nr:hypothetical protein [Pseudogemmobacter bohemicus]